jgi:hypothetical protein
MGERIVPVERLMPMATLALHNALLPNPNPPNRSF